MNIPHKILKPCPFCGVVPTLEWEEWKEISETAGVYVLEANHREQCFFRMMNGMNSVGRMSSSNLRRLEEVWNDRFFEDGLK